MKTDSRKRSGSDTTLSGEPVKKRPATALTMSDVALPSRAPVRTIVPLSGVPFRQALAKADAEGHGTVLLGANLPVHYRSEGRDKSLSVPIGAKYHPKEQVRGSEQELWTQGMMEGYGRSTVWADMLPKTLDLGSAQHYGRAIKSVMGGTVKSSDLGALVAPNTKLVKPRTGGSRVDKLTPSAKQAYNETAALGLAHRFIAPAITSFVEDLTGASATNTAYTGSAVRASFLHAKLLLKEDPRRTDSPLLTNFNEHVRKQLPQLNKDGASALADIVSEEVHAGRNDTAEAYQKSTLNIHHELDGAIDRTFERKRERVERKWEKYESRSMDIGDMQARIARKAGRWWSDAVVQSGKLEHPDTAVEYADRKRSRYGIGKVPE